MRFSPSSRSRGIVVTTLLLAGLGQAPASANPPGPSDFGDAVWIGSSNGLLKVASSDGAVLFEIGDAQNISSLAIDDVRGTVWTWTSAALLRAYDFSGTPLITETVTLPDGSCAPDNADDDPDPDDNLAGRGALAVDDRDGSLWIGTGRNVVHLNSSGTVLQTLSTPARIRSIALDPTHSKLWVAQRRSLVAYSPSLVVITTVSLAAADRVRRVSVDSSNGDLWVSLKKSLRRYAASGTQFFSIALEGGREIASDSHGNAWVATKTSLLRVSSTGVLVLETTPFVDGKRLVALVANPANQSSWVGTRVALENIATDASTIHDLDFGSGFGLRALGLYSDVRAPSLHLTAPADGALLTSAQPAFKVGFSDVGSGGDPATLLFRRDGTQITMNCVSLLSTATCIPASALPQGSSTIVTTIRDRAGNVSAAASVTIMIDSVAPEVTITAPTGAAVIATTSVTVQGSLSEPAIVFVNGSAATITGLTFSATVSLAPGSNTITATAYDSAANHGSTSITVTQTSSGPSVSSGDGTTGTEIVAGTPGTAPPGAAIVLTDASSGETVSVIASGDGSFSATMHGLPGDNITVTIAGTTTTTVPVGGTFSPPNPAAVAPPLDRTVATNFSDSISFLFTGASRVQVGFDLAALVPSVLAVVHGSVRERAAAPLGGVRISVLGHPEFGSTLTRADGAFDLVVDAGSRLIFTFEKSGLFPVQRSLLPAALQFATLDDVVMIGKDTNTSLVSFGTPSAQVARGSPVVDASGARTATLIIPPGVTASFGFPDGTTEPAPALLSIHITEYTVGESGPAAMPGDLPPLSKYTYALEYSADEAVAAGAEHVIFSEPVFAWTENITNFPVGASMPVGSYDRDAGTWKGQPDGRVVKVLSVTSGLADLDVDGNGTAASPVGLAALRITGAERLQLAALYLPGEVLWRVPITHFSPLDFNAAAVIDCQGECDAPDEPPPAPESPDVPDPCQVPGSIVDCENQALGESFGITGSIVSLMYRSDRQAGRKDKMTIRIPLTGSTVPAGLLDVRMTAEIDGEKVKDTFSPSPNLSTTFTWDGLDGFGRPVSGPQVARVGVGYTYHLRYALSSSGGWPVDKVSFNTPLAVVLAAGGVVDRASSTITFWKYTNVAVGTFDASGLRIAGLDLAQHHVYDPASRSVLLGDGSRLDASNVTPVIDALTGASAAPLPFGIDNIPAVLEQVNAAWGIAASPDGGYYFSEANGDRIRHVGADGILRTYAGPAGPSNPSGYSGDGGPARGARFHAPLGIALGPDGSLYIADSQNHVVRKIDRKGIVSTLAGTGVYASYGDEGPATEAALRLPTSVAVGPDGSVFIVDHDSSRVRRVTPDGIIRTFAGTGEYGFSGDGPAVSSLLGHPQGVSVGPDGGVYIAEADPAGRIRKIDRTGMMRVIAGNADNNHVESCEACDPMSNWIGHLNAVHAAPNGEIYWSETQFFFPTRIRKIANDGKVYTVAASTKDATFGYSAGQPALATSITNPEEMTVDATGSLLFTERGTGPDSRIRRVSPALPGYTGGGFLIPSQSGSAVYAFDASGRHVATKDATTGSTTLSFAYDARGLLMTITDRSGNVTSVHRDGQGDVFEIVAPGGEVTSIGLDANRRVSSITDPGGNVTQLAMSSMGLLNTLRDPRGNLHSFTWNSTGRLLRDSSPDGSFVNLARTGSSTVAEVVKTSALGRTLVLHRDTATATTEARTTTATDGTVSSTTLTETNRVATSTAADGTRTTTTLSGDPRFGMNAPLADSIVATPGGRTREIAETRSTTGADPSAPASLTSRVALNGKTFTSVWTAATRTMVSSTPAGRQRVLTLDVSGRVISSQTGDFEPVAISYDAHGRVAAVSQASELLRRNYSFVYDPVKIDQLMGITDPLSREIQFHYDATGRVDRQTLPDASVVAAAFDASGNLTTLTPPGKPAHGFSYTSVDQQQSYTPPAASGTGDLRTAYAYNADRQLSGVTRPDAATVSPTYDPTKGRVTSLAWSAGTETFSYDATSGKLSGVTAPGGISLALGYDGPLSTSESWSGAVSGSVSRTFNNDFRLVTEKVNGSSGVTYFYDDDGLVTGVESESISRSASTGQILGSTLGGVTTTRAYNRFGEPSRDTAAYAGGTIFDAVYDDGAGNPRDKLGRIAHLSEAVQGIARAIDYAYDARGRLTAVQIDGVTARSYTWDSNGNRLTKVEGASTTSYIYDDQDRLLCERSTPGSDCSSGGPGVSVAYSWTANGELASKIDVAGVTTYSYDELGNLRVVSLPNGDTIDYLIDGAQRRVGRKRNGTLEKVWVYRNSLKPVAELDGSGNLVARFVYGSKGQVPDYIVKGGVTYRVISDHLGTPRLIVDQATGMVAERIDVDEWGVVTNDSNPGFQPFGFDGGLFDGATGLVRFGARDYQASVGRWTAKDAAGLSAGTNVFQFAVDDPENYIDMTGFQEILVGQSSIWQDISLGDLAELGDALGAKDPKVRPNYRLSPGQERFGGGNAPKQCPARGLRPAPPGPLGRPGEPLTPQQLFEQGVQDPEGAIGILFQLLRILDAVSGGKGTGTPVIAPVAPEEPSRPLMNAFDPRLHRWDT